MSKFMQYTLKLYAMVPIDEGGSPTFDKRQIEKHLMQVLRKAEPDCYLEVMESEEIDDLE